MPSVDLTSISGLSTTVRTLFGHELYRIDQLGDGIVAANSQAGYPGSAGHPTPTGYRLDQPDVSCDQTTDQTLSIAAQLVPPVPARVLGTWVRAIGAMTADSQTMADISAGRLTLFSGTSWVMTALTSPCGHSRVLHERRTQELVLADVERALSANPPPAPDTSPYLIAPGRIGPYRVGADAHTLLAAGLIKPDPDPETCDHKWADVSDSVWTEFRGADPDELDTVSLANASVATSRTQMYKTAEGISERSTVGDLKRAYGTRLRYFEMDGEGGPFANYAVFGPGGVVVFILDVEQSYDGSEAMVHTDSTRLLGIAVDDASDTDSIDGGIYGGC
jgi:hypothetical protein